MDKRMLYIGGVVYFILITTVVGFIWHQIARKFSSAPKFEEYMITKMGVLCIVFSLASGWIGTRLIQDHLLGGKEIREFERQYPILIKKYSVHAESAIKRIARLENFHSSVSSDIAFAGDETEGSGSKDQAGIIVIKSTNYGAEKKLAADFMFLIPDSLRPVEGSDPKLIVVVTPESKHVATRYGAGARDIYDNWYNFEIRNFPDGEYLAAFSSEPESDKQSFPRETFMIVLHTADSLLSVRQKKIVEPESLAKNVETSNALKITFRSIGGGLLVKGSNGLNTMPYVMSRTAPEYPEIAGRAGIGGDVLLRLLITKSGNVRKAVVIRSEALLFESSVVEAGKKWTFSPMILSGAPVEYYADVPFRFYMKDYHPKVVIPK